MTDDDAGGGELFFLLMKSFGNDPLIKQDRTPNVSETF